MMMTKRAQDDKSAHRPARRVARHTARRCARRGSVLLVVVVVIMLLSLAAYQFTLSTQTEHVAVAAAGDRLLAQQSAMSARDLLAVVLGRSRQDRDRVGGLQHNPRLLGGRPKLLMAQASALPGAQQSEAAGPESFETTSGLADSGLPGPPIGMVVAPRGHLSNLSGQFGGMTAGMNAGFGDGSVGGPVSGAAGTAWAGGAAGGFDSGAGRLDSSGTSSFGGSSSLESAAGGMASGAGFGGRSHTRFGVVNESSKLHLAQVMAWNQLDPEWAEAALLAMPGMDADTAASILDWLDADQEPRRGGAEAEFYAALARPLTPRNGLPPDLDELLFVQGVTAMRLWGTRSPPLVEPELTGGPIGGLTGGSGSGTDGGQGQLLGGDELLGRGSLASSPGASLSESDESNQMGQLGFGQSARVMQPWAELLTVYSAERNETYEGQPRIWLNASDLRQLHADLSRVMPKPWADFVILFRQHGQVPAPPQSVNATGEDWEAEPAFDAPRQLAQPPAGHLLVPQVEIDFAQPAEVDIENPSWLLDAFVRLPAESANQKPRAVHSPLNLQMADAAGQLARFFDAVTVIRGPRIVGRINVDLAPASVLRAIPGLGAEQVQAILAARRAGSGAGSAYGGVGGGEDGWSGSELSQGGAASYGDQSNWESGGTMGLAGMQPTPLRRPLARRSPIWLLTSGAINRATMQAIYPYVTCGGDVVRAHLWGFTDDRSPLVHYEVVLDATAAERKGRRRQKAAAAQQVYFRELAAPRDAVRLPGSDANDSFGFESGVGTVDAEAVQF